MVIPTTTTQAGQTRNHIITKINSSTRQLMAPIKVDTTVHRIWISRMSPTRLIKAKIAQEGSIPNVIQIKRADPTNSKYKMFEGTIVVVKEADEAVAVATTMANKDTIQTTTEVSRINSTNNRPNPFQTSSALCLSPRPCPRLLSRKLCSFHKLTSPPSITLLIPLWGNKWSVTQFTPSLPLKFMETMKSLVKSLECCLMNKLWTSFSCSKSPATSKRFSRML